MKLSPRIHRLLLLLTVLALCGGAVLIGRLLTTGIEDVDSLYRYEAFCRKKVNFNYLLVSLLSLGYYLYAGKVGGFRQSFLWFWPVLSGFCLLRFLAVHFSISIWGATTLPLWAFYSCRALCFFVLAMFLIVETSIAITCFREPPKGVGCLIIHGAQTGSTVLNKRISVAAGYLESNPATLSVASGGQGKNEAMSEADYISEKLILAGIPKNRVIIENTSRTTLQNIRNSVKLMPDPTVSIALVSDDYHLFRAKALARRVLHRRVYGLPVHTARVTLPHAMMREFFSTLKLTLKGELFI